MASSKIVCIFASSNKKERYKLFIMDRHEILSELESRKKQYELDGVEITEGDVDLVIERVNGGMYLEDSVDEILEGIKECLC